MSAPLGASRFCAASCDAWRASPPSTKVAANFKAGKDLSAGERDCECAPVAKMEPKSPGVSRHSSRQNENITVAIEAVARHPAGHGGPLTPFNPPKLH
jgi:hypothetical protein